MIRDEKNGIIGGIIQGIANRFNMDAVALRVLVVIFGLGLACSDVLVITYILLWVILPSE